MGGGEDEDVVVFVAVLCQKPSMGGDGGGLKSFSCQTQLLSCVEVEFGL